MNVYLPGPFLKHIGTQLLRLRNAKHEKQLNVAHATGISTSAISKIEGGNDRHLTIEKLLTLVNYYQASLSDVLPPC